ncbi:hypothetical protein BS47DRAFT_1367083 [Hydnum rufescens UP504]|uniref:Uncharacterized protein n=1 Tax=Hydnum rufescens UP504 TaxID=1448309 RepID=A0A9P6DPY8_9AGAM|nr:hypothetical protein BS47DRAFT_1367083 [Hydnum rufescens UP504]
MQSTCPTLLMGMHKDAELSAEYAKEKGQYEDDPEGLEAWQEELCMLARCSKVDNDVTLTTGSKLAKFISQKKKNLMAEEEFNLKKTLDDLFVKVLTQWLDARGLSKWHQETEKKQQEDELRSHNSAYSATSKYLQNLFIENGHTWFPALVGLVKMNVQPHIRPTPTRAGRGDSGAS